MIPGPNLLYFYPAGIKTSGNVGQNVAGNDSVGELFWELEGPLVI